jgi:hypothetical protein
MRENGDRSCMRRGCGRWTVGRSRRSEGRGVGRELVVCGEFEQKVAKVAKEKA